MKTILAPARLFTVATLLALTSPAAFAQVPATPATTAAPGGTAAAKPLAPPDKKFITDSGKSFYYELRLADAAKTGAKADATKKYAESVNKDLQKAWEKLGEIANAKGEKVPTELVGSDKGKAERLKKMKPDGFDKVFFKEILSEAKSVERDFVSAAKSSADPEIKQFATDYLPSVKNHVIDGEKAEKEAAKAK